MGGVYVFYFDGDPIYCGESADVDTRVDYHVSSLKARKCFGYMPHHPFDTTGKRMSVVINRGGMYVDKESRLAEELRLHDSLRGCGTLISSAGRNVDFDNPVHKQISEGKNVFVGANRWRSPQATPNSRAMWYLAGRFYEYYKEHGSKPRKCAEYHGLDMCKPIQNIFREFREGWVPLLDEEYVEWHLTALSIS